MALKLGELVAYLKADDTHLARGVKAAQDRMRQAGQKAREYAPVVGAAMAAGIGAGLLGGMNLEAARAKLSAQVGDPALAQRIGEAAGRVYGRGFGETAADAMLAARAVMQSGLLPKNADAAIIEDITVKAQTLAQVFDLDVTQAARAAGQMVKTGLARNAEEALDIITRGFQESGDQAGDLLDNFSEYSTQFRKLGLSGADAMGLMNQGVQAGARDLDTVADALKEFAIRAADGSKSSAEGFKAIGLNADKMTAIFAKGGPAARDALGTVLERLQAMKDPTEREAAAVALFGTKAEDLQGALGALDLDTAAKSLGNVGGAAGRAGDALEKTSAQKLEAFKRQVQSALVEKIGEAIPTLEKVGKWAIDNSSTLLTVGGVIAGLAVSVWAVQGAMAAWNAVTLIWTGITKVATAAQWLWNAAMMANPIGLVILAIVALVAGIYLLWTNSEAFRKFFIGLWEHVSSFVVAVFQKWWSVFSGFWGAVLSGIASAGRWIRDKVGDLVGWFTGLPGRLRRGLANVASVVSAPFRAGFNAVARAWNATVGRLSWSVPSWVPGIGGRSISAPRLPMLAKGGHILGAGMAIVGEAGPELVHLGRGATVQPLTGAGSGGGGGGIGVLRLIVATPDGRTLKNELIDAASLRGQTVGRYLGVTT
ncbi:phage tail protein [Micromonospora sp. LHW51205]|uniref:phage tail tape measure protein n=1 Tax=Micromonospora sp. LHW51205 TaxID=2248752 RepID=UPI000DEB0978|nr:phage tail tape measure protein [Micromonospora sp. LHW51205]RBQ05149.1 phage tail protein [Micromonospora sp. LHW51205]